MSKLPEWKSKIEAELDNQRIAKQIMQGANIAREEGIVEIERSCEQKTNLTLFREPARPCRIAKTYDFSPFPESPDLDSRRLHDVVTPIRRADDKAVLRQLCGDAGVQIRKTDTNRLERTHVREGIEKVQVAACPDTLVVQQGQQGNLMDRNELAKYLDVRERGSFFGLFDGLFCFATPAIEPGRALIYRKDDARLKLTKLRVVQEERRISISYQLQAWFMDKKAAATITYGSG